jgi:hypothetical protein
VAGARSHHKTEGNYFRRIRVRNASASIPVKAQVIARLHIQHLLKILRPTESAEYVDSTAWQARMAAKPSAL